MLAEIAGALQIRDVDLDVTHNKLQAILAEWDPVEVGPQVAQDEYQQYIGRLRSVGAGGDLQEIRTALERILTDEIGLDYDPGDNVQVSEITYVAARIRRICKR